jgi:polyisoprenyl-teichoic acid--peptidoglycan teichoic acid transferase
MRKPKKPPKKNSAADKDFERLYHTIPDYKRQQTAEPLRRGVPEGQSAPTPRWKKVLKRMLIILLVLMLLAGLWLGWKFVSNNVKIFGWQGLVDMFKTTKLRGEDEGRVNILLAGNSADDPGHNGAELTDSIMLVSINTKDKSGYIISIPRDLYLDIPGHDYAKINEAYQNGKRRNFSEPGYPPGGMGLLEKTVSEHFGVDIHYYALVNYTALKEAVNAVGGIQVTIASSDPRGLRDPSPDLQNGRKPLVDLPNGTVTLDGAAALGLARARGNARGSYGYGQSDFTRTENQRMILLGLKEKATSLGTLSNPVKLGQLMDSMGNHVETDFKAGELRRLYGLSKEIPSASIISASLNDADGKNLLQSYRTRRGQSALVPAAGIDDYTVIQAYLQKLSSPVSGGQ